MNDAFKTTGLKTKKEAVELGLKTLIKLKKQEGIRQYRAKREGSGDEKLFRLRPKPTQEKSRPAGRGYSDRRKSARFLTTLAP